MKTMISLKPTIFVIFGGTGDLNMRKLAPALYNLYADGYMPEKFATIGTARKELSDEKFRDVILDGVNSFSRTGKVKKDKWAKFAENIHYTPVDVSAPATFEGLKEKIESIQKGIWPRYTGDLLPCCGTKLIPDDCKMLSDYKLAGDEETSRIVIEKPFGRDLETAKELNCLLTSIFTEKQIYRIDHYLGKETVQNIMAFRFANSFLEPLWNRTYIDHVQISVTEQLGVGDRGGYYEGAGALRDMIQNHLLQLLCLIGMETPINFDADEIRNKKVDVLKAMRPFSPEDIRFSTVRGQYTKGWVEGKEVPGYRHENGVAPDSNTETFAAIKFFVDNWRWQGVPFYVRTGKRLFQTSSLITIQFKDVPHHIFPSAVTEHWQQNRLIISIQPEMSIRLQVQGKRPGLDMVLNPVDMVFDYKGTYDYGHTGSLRNLVTGCNDG